MYSISKKEFYIDVVISTIKSTNTIEVTKGVKEYFDIDLTHSEVSDCILKLKLDEKNRSKEICMNNMFKEFY